MDKSEGKDWFAKTLNNVTEETAKVYKISRLKLEMGTLNKSRNEKLNLLSRKLLELISSDKIDSEQFEPEYSAILNIENKIASKEFEIDDLKSSLKIGIGKRMDTPSKDSDTINEERDKAEPTDR